MFLSRASLGVVCALRPLQTRDPMESRPLELEGEEDVECAAARRARCIDTPADGRGITFALRGTLADHHLRWLRCEQADIVPRATSAAHLAHIAISALCNNDAHEHRATGGRIVLWRELHARLGSVADACIAFHTDPVRCSLYDVYALYNAALGVLLDEHGVAVTDTLRCICDLSLALYLLEEWEPCSGTAVGRAIALCGADFMQSMGCIAAHAVNKLSDFGPGNDKSAYARAESAAWRLRMRIGQRAASSE